MKGVAVLGSTGSIGTNTLDVIAGARDRLRLVGIAARANIDRVEEQIAAHEPQLAVVVNEAAATALARRNPSARVLRGVGGLVELVTHPDVDVVVFGTSGTDALVPLFRAIEAGKEIALASKELLVMAGELVMRAAEQAQTRVIPIDSEHSALFQLLRGVSPDQVHRLIVTGSGGSLWSADPAADADVTPERVLRHPKWSMGPKITVDSATLMNKGLEVIEAHWLFGVPYDRIDVVIHPQAVVHGLVELSDGSCLAHLSPCDMRLPIQYALSLPQRWTAPAPRLRLTELSGLEFFEPDVTRFPCLRLALSAARAGGTAPAVLSAANDVAVEAFLQRRLPFGGIPLVIDDVLSAHRAVRTPNLDEILAADRWAREQARLAVEVRRQRDGHDAGERRPAAELVAPSVARSLGS
jgi:1-deoxy-D-xylulose-5-phosphate reductoisomerase